MHGGHFAKFVLSLVALVVVAEGALAREPLKRFGPVSPATLQKMKPQPQPKGREDGAVAHAVAEISAFRCANPDLNIKASIPVIADMTLQNIAVSRRLATGALKIYFNPKYMGLFNPATALFWLEHECMHHQLGHTLKTHAAPLTGVQRAAEEDAADCAAIKIMVKRQPPMINAENLKAIEGDIEKLTGGGFYKTGPQRAAWVDSCVMGAVQDIKARRKAAQTP